MIQTIYFNTPKKYEELKNVSLPPYFHFIIKFINEDKFVLGFVCTFEDISINEMKMIHEGFNF